MHLALPPDHHLAGCTSVRLERALRRGLALRQQRGLLPAADDAAPASAPASCPDIAYESNDYTVMQALISAGMGVTLIPDLALLLRNPGIAVVEVVPDPPVRRVWAATLEAGSRSTAADAMVEILAEVGATVGDEVCAAA